MMTNIDCMNSNLIMVIVTENFVKNILHALFGYKCVKVRPD